MVAFGDCGRPTRGGGGLQERGASLLAGLPHWPLQLSTTTKDASVFHTHTHIHSGHTICPALRTYTNPEWQPIPMDACISRASVVRHRGDFARLVGMALPCPNHLRTTEPDVLKLEVVFQFQVLAPMKTPAGSLKSVPVIRWPPRFTIHFRPHPAEATRSTNRRQLLPL